MNMNIAHVVDGVVTAIEVADNEWLEGNREAYPDKTFVVVPDGIYPTIGTTYNDIDGFDDLWRSPDPLAPVDPNQPSDAAIEAALAGN